MAKYTPKNPRKLTPLQARFVDEYLIDLNATAAYKRAGYQSKAENAAAVSAMQLLKLPHVAAAISVAQAARAKRTAVTADRVLAELARIGFGNARLLFDADGHLLELKDLPEDVSASVASVKILKEKVTAHGENVLRRESTIEVKSWDKVKALELMGKHLGMFRDVVDLNAKLTAAPDPEVIRGMSDEDLAKFKAGAAALLALLPGRAK